MPNSCISYSIFGYSDDLYNPQPFYSYLRGLQLNIRLAGFLYPDWHIYVSVDKNTYASKFRPYFEYLERSMDVHINVVESQPLCRMMLQRLNPIFAGVYERVICRDADSLLQYRERMAVEYWVNTNRVAHAITDSISHNIALMGGMIGLKCLDVRLLLKVNSLDEMLNFIPSHEIDYNIKGTDQDFLNRIILPKVADSLTEHYIKGMPNSFRSDYHNTIDEVELPGVKPELRETDNLGWHIGASGFQMDATVAFLKGLDGMCPIEKQYPEVFYWHLK